MRDEGDMIAGAHKPPLTIGQVITRVAFSSVIVYVLLVAALVFSGA